MRYAVALMFSLLLMMTATRSALACSPVAPPPLEDPLAGATALAYGQVTTEYTSGRVILPVKSYAGPGPSPEQLSLQWTSYQVNPDCSKGARWSLLGTEVVVVLKGTPPDLSESAVSRAGMLYVDNLGQIGMAGGKRVDELLGQFATDHDYPVQNRTTPAPDPAPVSDGPPWDTTPPAPAQPPAGAENVQPEVFEADANAAPPTQSVGGETQPSAGLAPRGFWFLAGAGALILAVATDAYLGRRRRLSRAQGAGGTPDRHRLGI